VTTQPREQSDYAAGLTAGTIAAEDFADILTARPPAPAGKTVAYIRGWRLGCANVRNLRTRAAGVSDSLPGLTRDLRAAVRDGDLTTLRLAALDLADAVDRHTGGAS
jgi:hypothetical protein